MRHAHNVSVIIPYYNGQRWIGEALDSVLQQRVTGLEIILVDDGSAPAAKAALEPYLDFEEVRYIRQDNRGPAAARNLGMRHATGRHVAFLDADDVWLNDKLTTQLEIMETSDAIKLVYGDSLLVDSSGRVIEANRVPRLKCRTQFMKEVFYGRVSHFTSTILAERAAVEQVGGMDLLRYREDHLFLMKMVYQFETAHIDKPLSRKRITGDSYTGRDSRLDDPEALYRRNRAFMDRAVSEFPEILESEAPKALAKLARSIAMELAREGRRRESLVFLHRALRHHPGRALDLKSILVVLLVFSPLSYGTLRTMRSRVGRSAHQSEETGHRRRGRLPIDRSSGEGSSGRGESD